MPSRISLMSKLTRALLSVACMVGVSSCAFSGYDKIGHLSANGGHYSGDVRLKGRHESVVIRMPSDLTEKISQKTVSVWIVNSSGNDVRIATKVRNHIKDRNPKINWITLGPSERALAYVGPSYTASFDVHALSSVDLHIELHGISNEFNKMPLKVMAPWGDGP